MQWVGFYCSGIRTLLSLLANVASNFMDILENFGVKPIFLIAQIVNFLILLFILQRFLYKPILKVLEERKKKVAESLKNAEEIEKRLTEITAEKDKQIKETVKESEKILEGATKSANEIIQEARSKASVDIKRMFEKSQKEAEAEREKMRQEIKAELAGLVVAGLEKVTGKVLTEKDQKELVQKSLKDLHED